MGGRSICVPLSRNCLCLYKRSLDTIVCWKHPQWSVASHSTMHGRTPGRLNSGHAAFVTRI